MYVFRLRIELLRSIRSSRFQEPRPRLEILGERRLYLERVRGQREFFVGLRDERCTPFLNEKRDRFESESVWKEVSPLLEEAMAQLRRTDQDAVLLRFFAEKSLREVGQALGVSDDSAQKRVNRALERMREYFARRGVVLPAALLGLTLKTEIMSAPARRRTAPARQRCGPSCAHNAGSTQEAKRAMLGNRSRQESATPARSIRWPARPSEHRSATADLRTAAGLRRKK